MGSISSNNNPINAEKQSKRNNGDINTAAYNQDKEIEKRLSPDGTRKLQDEINTLTKKNCELESQLRRSLEAGHSKDIHLDTLDGADSCEEQFCAISINMISMMLEQLLVLLL